MSLTGGKLNWLNGKYGISAPEKSVPVMKLIKAHNPQSKSELCDLIKYHHENICACGIVSKGTIEDFGTALFHAQLKEWGKAKFSLAHCMRWEFDLFVTQSLKGQLLEKKAVDALSQLLKSVQLTVESTDGFLDEQLRIDLMVKKEEKIICGVQVKPITYKKIDKRIISYNNKANGEWGKPVFYLFYLEKEEFYNIDQVMEDILKLI